MENKYAFRIAELYYIKKNSPTEHGSFQDELSKINPCKDLQI